MMIPAAVAEEPAAGGVPVPMIILTVAKRIELFTRPPVIVTNTRERNCGAYMARALRPTTCAVVTPAKVAGAA